MKPAIAILGPLLVLFCLAEPTMADSAPTPHDYYSGNYSEQLLDNVEKFHLPPARQKMQRGQWEYATNDIEFVLAYFPNHPEALQLATEIGILTGNPKRGDRYYIDAVQQYPRSPETQLLYGMHLHRTGRLEEAVEHYRQALDMDDSMLNAHYNLGLVLVELGRLEEARAEAERAYALGHPLPGLRNKLQAKGAW